LDYAIQNQNRAKNSKGQKYERIWYKTKTIDMIICILR
jgi:hypothetical protein